MKRENEIIKKIGNLNSIDIGKHLGLKRSNVFIKDKKNIFGYNSMRVSSRVNKGLFASVKFKFGHDPDIQPANQKLLAKPRQPAPAPPVAPAPAPALTMPAILFDNPNYDGINHKIKIFDG